MTLVEAVVLVAAGLSAGIANAVAGGGSLIAFPALLWTGQGAVAANVTNTVSLWPGYLAGGLSYRDQLAEDRDRAVPLAVVGAVGGAAGSALLLVAPPGVFDAIVPYLVLLAVALLAAQPRIKAAVDLRRARRSDGTPHSQVPLFAAILLGSVYGGYFGGGLGVILLAVLGIFLPDDLGRLNGLKNALALVVNTLALVAFGLFGPVSWLAVAVVGPAAMAGGVIGSRAARRLPPPLLRGLVVAWGTVVGIVLLVG